MMQTDDDQLVFVDEIAEAPGEEMLLPSWPLLVVDDDEDVHHATEFALRGLQVLGRSLEFLHASSAAGALDVLGQRPDVAVVLLDVVMEREDAGLRAVERIRNELGMAAVRIVLRTGQPGYAPELEAISNYDINDYKTKSELTRSKLFTTVTAAIRSFDQIHRLEASRSGLELIAEGAIRFNAEHGLHAFGAAVLAQMAALLGVPASGVICLDAPGNEPGLLAGRGPVVLAGAGQFSRYAGQPLAMIDAGPVRQLLDACLAEERNQFAEHCLALSFPGRQGRRLAACLESAAPLREVDRHLLDVFCANISICGENVELVERLRTTAYVDALTGLPNRAAQITAIDQMARIGAPSIGAVALVDIDQFSETIDAFGYRFGDEQLRAVAGRLRAALPDEVYVARVGGDVFSVCGDPALVNSGKLRAVLAEPFDGEGGQHTIYFSIGLVHPDGLQHSGADLLRDAAVALKRAKSEGPGNAAVYTPEVGEQTRQRVHLLHHLRSAFDAGQLYLAYQPQLDLATRRPVGVEALLRWPEAGGGFVPLDQLISVAEQSGMIVELGAWVVQAALATQRRLVADGFELRMAINVSAVQFHHPGFVTMLEQALATASVDPSRIELEITESIALRGCAQIEERLRAVKLLGVSLAIDDFGTGFSSLSYLDRLGADCLKIDRSFVAAIDGGGSGKRIADLIIQLGHHLGMRVIAEGVEQPAQLDILAGLGCHEAQGWCYASAMPQAELLHWLEAAAR
ncbi:MAG: EAL domain-containing protein [Betaproteobacteria bacterium]